MGLYTGKKEKTAHMITIPNLLSFIRIPLALVFLQADPTLRAVAILIAMASDGLDGFIARRYNMISRIGVFLDPIADKFFVIFIISTFLQEGSMGLFEAAAFICRDFSVLLFGIYLAVAGKLNEYRFRSIWCGKATTFLQFIALLAINFGFVIPSAFFTIFVVLGLLALVELYIPLNTKTS